MKDPLTPAEYHPDLREPNRAPETVSPLPIAASIPCCQDHYSCGA
jgi:hypothetical protein